MKNYFTVWTVLYTLVCTIHSYSAAANQKALPASDNIRLNQLGYYPQGPKRIMVVHTQAIEFQLIDGTGKTVFTGPLQDKGVWEASKEQVKMADFTSFKKSGTYRLWVPDCGFSHSFEIKQQIYADAFKAALKAFYLQRVSTAIEDKYAGKFSHPLAHPDTHCYYHPSSGKSSGSISSPKGWYDAGDYNKYIVNAGFTVSLLLTFYEDYGSMAPDRLTNIPESGNQVSDLLDEIKYELDWAETMQDQDGGVFFKLTAKTFCGFVKPQDDTLPRYIVGKSTSSALNFAAMFGQASRVWRTIDPVLAKRYLSQSQKAWDWAVKNPQIIFMNPPDIFTGAYSHADFSGDFYWAAAQLYVTTGQARYRDYLEKNPVAFTFVPSGNWWSYLKNLGYYSLILPVSKLPGAEKENLKKAILREADAQLLKLEASPYRQPLNSFVWGSNSDILDLAVLFAQAFRINRQSKFLDAAVETTDYIFGKNAVGLSFVTGFGARSAMHPHFRLAAADDIPEPIPGWVVGGPNAEFNDKYSSRNPYGVKYDSNEPAKAYMDLEASYASNEIAINWNAPLVYITGFLDHSFNIKE